MYFKNLKSTKTWEEMTPGEQEVANEVRAAAERGYRKGAFTLLDRIIDALQAGATIDDLVGFYNGPLYSWRYSRNLDPAERPSIQEFLDQKAASGDDSS